MTELVNVTVKEISKSIAKSMIVASIGIGISSIKHQHNKKHNHYKYNKNNIKITVDDYNNISITSNEDSTNKYKLYKRLEKTNNWIDYAKYYMTHTDANMIDVDNEIKEFVNYISTYANFGKIYDNSGICDINKYDGLNKSYDIDNAKFLVYKDILERELLNDKFQDDMKKRIIESSISTSDETEKYELVVLPTPTDNQMNQPVDTSDNGVITINGVRNHVLNDGTMMPVFTIQDDFSTKKTIDNIPKNKGNLSKTLFNRLEKSFRSLLIGRKYYYDLSNNGMITLTVYDDEYRDHTYIVDNGKVMGGTQISILGYVARPDGYLDTTFVNANKHQDIVSKILSMPFYCLTIDEINSVVKDYFSDTTIYKYIDFSNTGWLDKLSDDEKNLLQTKLTKVSFKLSSTDKGARFRFSNFKSVTDFKLVSDNKVISPFAENNTTSRYLIDNMYFVSKDGDRMEMIITDKKKEEG